jgi:hypothetical protein
MVIAHAKFAISISWISFKLHFIFSYKSDSFSIAHGSPMIKMQKCIIYSFQISNGIWRRKRHRYSCWLSMIIGALYVIR